MQKALCISILAFFLSVTPAFAGGGPLGIDDVSPLKPFETTKTFIVGVSIYQPNCDSIDVKGSLQETTDGDSVMSFTPPSDGTYYEPHYFTGAPQNTWTKICKRYFKVTSTLPKQRTFIAQAIIDGETAKITYPVAFGDDQYSKELQNFERYNGTPQIDVISEKSLGGPKREVKVQWNPVAGVKKYAIYARELISNEQQTEVSPFGEPLMTTSETKATLNLASALDFNLSAIACENNICTPPTNPYEVLLSRMQSPGFGNSEEISQPLPLLTPTSNPNEDKMEKLNKKIAALEEKLKDSNKKQNVLEEKLNQLLSFIRSLFPNFQ